MCLHLTAKLIDSLITLPSINPEQTATILYSTRNALTEVFGVFHVATVIDWT